MWVGLLSVKQDEVKVNETSKSLLACPSCRGNLQWSGAASTCTKCNIHYPVIDDMPWLLPDPMASLEQWRGRLQMLLKTIHAEASVADASLSAQDLRPNTRKRLTLWRDGKWANLKQLGTLLQAIAIPSEGSLDLSRALKARLPHNQTLASYFNNLHRDWCYGEQENKAAAAIISGLVDSREIADTLVLGTGAGRLAYDLSQVLNCRCMIGLDFNPLMLAVAKRMYAGETLELMEFPIAPRALSDIARLRTLKAPQGAIKSESLLIAGDCLAPPVKAKAFNTVLTPWLIDILPTSFDHIAHVINNLLAVGGQWINFGSLAFDQKNPRFNYTRDEVAELLESMGMVMLRDTLTTVPYLKSDASLHAREETTYAFIAQKRTDLPLLPHKPNLPAWLMDPTISIPRQREHDGLELAHGIYIEVIKLIDGRRSLDAINAEFAPKHGMSKEQGLAALRQFLAKQAEEINAMRP